MNKKNKYEKFYTNARTDRFDIPKLRFVCLLF
jgi:hypothetical protein